MTDTINDNFSKLMCKSYLCPFTTCLTEQEDNNTNDSLCGIFLVCYPLSLFADLIHCCCCCSCCCCCGYCTNICIVH